MDIDIFSIDKKIRDVWNNIELDIQKIDIEISEFKKLTQDSHLSNHVNHDISEKIKKLEKERKELEESLKNQYYYTIDFEELNQINQLNDAPKKISFMGKSNQNDKKISKLYLDILKKYNIEYKELEELTRNPVKKEKHICQHCKSQDFMINSEQNLEICQNCGKQDEKTYKSLSYKDISRVNMSSKYTYERRVHFKDCINQYQGKQNSTIDDKIYKDLEEQFESHGLLVGDETAPKKTRFQKITKEHILLFLKETNNSKHYEDVVLIYHKMTGKKVDDISHLENQLMEDFDKISNLYDKKFKFTKKVDRKSFINTQYVLFQLLRNYKYPCKKEDFNMLKTLDRKSFHDDIVKELFECLDLNFTPIF